MTMEEENIEQDPYAIDWSETAYFLPQPHLMVEEWFKEHDITVLRYKEYFTAIREQHGLPLVELKDPPMLTNSLKKKSSDKLKVVTPKKKVMKSGEGSSSSDVGQQRTDQIRYESKSSGNKLLYGKNPTDDQNYTVYHLLMKEPRKSSLTVFDRDFYHAFIKKEKKGMKAEKRMKDLTSRVVAEQNEYQQFLHRAALSNIDNYLFLNGEVRDYMLHNIHESVSKLAQHMKKFKLLNQISWHQLPRQTNLFLTFVRRVYEEGVIPTCKLPQLGTKLAFDEKLLRSRTKEISKDTIETICKSENVEFYMKSATLLTIMEALAVDTRECLLPLMIDEIETDKDAKRKVLTFTNPLPRRVLSTREVNGSYYRNVLKMVPQDAHLDVNSTHMPVVKGEEDSGVPGESLVIDMGEMDSNPVENTSAKESEDLSNIHVNLFTLGDLNILLETTVDQMDSTSQKTFQLSPKCEYQYVTGFEQFSLSELCHSFWDSHIANTDWIVCSRIDIRNDVITRNDTYTRDILCPPACPYNPRHYCNHLYYILKELLLLSPGEYILERAVGETHIKVFQENIDGFTLEMAYKDVLQKKEIIVDLASPWLPIDTAIITDLFLAHSWIPGLFGQFQEFDNKKVKIKKGKIRGKNDGTNRNKNFQERGNIPSPPVERAEPSNVSTRRPVTSYADAEF